MTKNNLYTEKKEIWLKKYNEKQNALRDQKRYLRKPKRRSSDGMLNVNIPSLFLQRITDHYENGQTKLVMQRENPDVDVPIRK